jgi:hypothetical protein
MNECVQLRELLEVARHLDGISPHLFGERCLANPVEYDTPPATDLLDSPDGGNRDSHCLYCRMDRASRNAAGFAAGDR